MMKMIYGLSMLWSTVMLHGTIGQLATTHIFEPTNCITHAIPVVPAQSLEASAPAIHSTRSFQLQSPAATVAWERSIALQDDGNGQMTAHFVIDARDVVDETGGIGVVLYIAGSAARQTGTYDFRIEITQRRPSSLVTVYAADDSIITGPVPLVQATQEVTPKPYLPWLDGMKQAYSIILTQYQGEACFLMIQHTKEKISNYRYQSPEVRTILETYARHERLQNQRHGYLDQVDHMRCLPISLTHQQYHHLQQNQNQGGSVAFAQLEGEVVVQGL
jgi:hypothetical protein